MCVFRSCHTLFNFQGPCDFADAKSVDITSGRSERPPFRLSPKPPLVAGVCIVGSLRRGGVPRDSFDIISLSFRFVNPFFQFFSNFLKVFFDGIFRTKSCGFPSPSPLGLVRPFRSLVHLAKAAATPSGNEREKSCLRDRFSLGVFSLPPRQILRLRSG